MEKVVYYYVMYIKSQEDEKDIEIHLKPFKTKEEAQEFQKESSECFGDRIVHQKIRRTDLNKLKDGYLI